MANEDKQHVVIVDGQRATGLLSEQDAQAEAAKRQQKLQEAGGQQAKESSVQVKQNLCG